MPTSRGRRLGTTWRRASRHVTLRRAHGKECPPLTSSSPRPPRNCKKQEPCAVTAAHGAQLRILARMLGCVSTSMSQGSTGPHLRSASRLRVRAAVRAHNTAMFVCLLACRAWHWPISATCDVSWRLRKPGTTPFWRRWRWSSGNLPSPQSLPRLRVPMAHCRCQNRRISGRGSRTMRLRRMVTGGRGHDVYLGSGPLDGGNTLRPA